MATRYFPTTSSPFYQEDDDLLGRADAFSQDILSNLPPEDLVSENPTPDWANDPIFQRASAFSDEMEQFLNGLDTTEPTSLQPSVSLGEGGPEALVVENQLVVENNQEPEIPTAGAGQLAKYNTELDKLIVENARNQPNVETSAIFGAFGDRVQEALNSPKFWDATPKEMQAEVNRIASEEFDDTRLADIKGGQWNFDELAAYRKTSGARPSPFGFQGEETTRSPDEDAPDIVQRTRQHLAKGSAGLFASENAALQAVQEAVGIDSSKANARREYYNAIANALPVGTKFNEIKSLGDAIGWAYNSAVEQAPNLATSISGGGLGATLIKGSIGARLGAFGSSYVLELGQIEQGNKELNPDQKAGLATFLGAAPAAALDALLPGKIGSQLMARIGKEEADKIALRMLLLPDKRWLVSLGASVAEGAAIEGSTEGLQQAIEEVSSSVETGKPISPGLLYRMVEAAATGAVAGGPANVIGDVAERQAQLDAPIQELAGAEFQRTPQSVATGLFTPQTPGGITPRRRWYPEARPIVRPVEQRDGPTVPVAPTTKPKSVQGEEQRILIPNGPITSRFGPRHSFTTLNGQKASSNHAGIDIGLAEGAKVPAAADGVVVFAGPKGGYGNAIIVKFSDGTSVLYGHLSKIGVEVGEQVAQGETVGNVGHTGNATGPHLHFERRDAQGRPVNPMSARMVQTTRQEDGTYADDTGLDAEPEPVDYGEFDQTQIDDTFEQATGQSLREPQEDTFEEEPTGIAAVAESVLSQPDTPVADIRIAGLEQAKDESLASQALKQELLSTTTLAGQSPQLPAQDFNQPLEGEEPVFDEDQETVVGFIDQSGNVRKLGEQPTGTESFVAAPLAMATATTPVATESSEEGIPEGARPRLTTAPYEGFNEERTHVAYEVAPGAASPLQNRWQALPLETQQRITTNVNRLVMPPVMRKLNLTGRITGHLGGWQGNISPSITLTTRAHHNALNAARYLGHALNQDAVMVLSERSVPNLEERGAVVVQIPEAQIPAAYQKLTAAGLGIGFTTNDKGMVAVNYSNIPTEQLAQQIDEALGGSYDVWSKDIHAALVERGEDDYGLQGNLEGRPVERADLNRLAARAGESLIRNIERAEGRAGANGRDGGERPFRFTKDLEKPPAENGSVVLDHFGPEGLTETDPTKWGQNSQIYSREERNYLSQGIPRTYFGIATGQPGGYANEFPNRVHYTARVPADKLYDVASDPDNLRTGKPWLTERAIRDAGYSGYWIKNPNLGLVAAVFEPVKLNAPKKTPQKKASPKKPEPAKAQRTAEKPKPQRAPEDFEAAKDRVRVFRQQVIGEVTQAMREMALIGRGDLSVELVDKIQPEGNEPADLKVAGYYYHNVIKIAAQQWKYTNPRNTLRHESIHWARENIFTNLEWAALAKWAKNNPSLMAWAKQAYPDEPRDVQIEEAVAEGFARWTGQSLMNIGIEPRGLAARALTKLREFIAAVQRAFGMAGISQSEINEAARILNEFQTGETVRKFDARRAAQRARQFGRKPSDMALSRALATGEITPEQYERAKASAPRFQTAWHGTHHPAIDQFKLDFVGSGEGAQAFGWGLYFAQAKEVADYYRTTVSGEVTLNGGSFITELKRLDPFLGGQQVAYDVLHRIDSYLRSLPGEPPKNWLSELRGQFEYENIWAQRDADNAGQLVFLEHLEQNLENGLAIFDLLQSQNIKGPKKGGLYEVDIPDNEHLLVYERRLKDQPKAVKEALGRLRADMKDTDALQTLEVRLNEDFWDWEGAQLIRAALPQYLSLLYYTDEGAHIRELVGQAPNDEAASIYLRALGVPGHRYRDQFSRGHGGESYNYVIYDDTQIKINARYRLVDDTLLSDPTVPNQGWGRVHTAVMGMLSSLGGKSFDPTDRLIDAWKRKIINKFQPIINTQKRVAKDLGVPELPPEINPYLDIATDERGYKLNYLADNFVRPMAESMSSSGTSMDDLGLYLYARHAPHRNARIAAINPEFNTATKPGSGMTNKEAADILQKFEDEGRTSELEDAAQYIDQMVQWAQDEMLDGGLISPKEIAQWFSPSEFYVPLRGNEALEPDVEFGFTPASLKGGGFSVSGREIHRMFGRASKADLEGIVGNVVTQAQMAADRGYRNKVAQKILNMLKTVPDQEFARLDRVKRVPVWNKAKGQVEYQIQKRVVNPEEQARTIYAKVAGTDHKITFNQHNPSAMRFVKAAKNLDMASLNRFLQVASAFTRLWSSLQTTYNPEFLVRNAARDIQTAMINSQKVDVDVKGLGRSIAKNILSLKPLKAAWSGAFHDTGALSGSANEWRATYAEFEANGGKLNYNQVEPVEEALRTLSKEYRRAIRGKLDPRRFGLKLARFIDHANSAVENMTRIAAYKALRDRGIEAKAAAKVARELTTNFAQHGEWGPTVNALYGFGNATLIGSARLTRTLVSKPQLLLGLMMLGFMQDFLNSWQDKEEWDQYSESDKDYHWTLLMPDWMGVNVHIPMGYGVNSFITIGRKISELMRGKKNIDGTKETVASAMGDVFGSFANAWSPVQGYTIYNMLSPSLLDPFVDIIQNKNHWGSVVMPSQPDRVEQQKPDSQLTFENTGEMWKGVAQGVNRATGGNEVVPGVIDVSPESLKHVVTELGGGALRTATRTANLVGKMATGETAEVGPNEIPFGRAFVGRPYGAANTESEVMSAFYDRVNQARLVVGRAKEMKARFGKESKPYQEFRKANEPIIDFAPRFEAYQKKLNQLNAADNAAKRGTIRAEGLNRRDRGAIFKATQKLVPQRKLTAEEVQALRAGIRDKKVKLAQRFNQRWLEEVAGE